MKRAISLPAIALLIAAAVVLAVRPWERSTTEEAVAHPAEYGICNVYFTGIPKGVTVGPVPRINEETGNADLYIMAWIPVEEVGVSRNESSRIVSDAVSGEKVFEEFRTAADEAKLKSLDRRIGRWYPLGPAWPRTDTAPQSEMAEVRGPMGAQGDMSILRYREPEYQSGLLTGVRYGDSFTDLRAYTCESVMVIDARTGAVTEKNIASEEEAMFDRFLSELVP